MPTTTTIPITITDEAAEYIRALGLQSEYERIIEQAKQFIPGLINIDVCVQPPYDLGGPDVVLINPYMEDRHLDFDPTQSEWDLWWIGNVSEYTSRHIVVLIHEGERDAG